MPPGSHRLPSEFCFMLLILGDLFLKSRGISEKIPAIPSRVRLAARFSLVALACFVGGSVAFGQAAPTGVPEAKPVVFRGMRRVPPETMRWVSLVPEGTALAPAELRGMVMRLDRTGWFDSIQVLEEDHRFIVSVTERPFLKGVEYTGSALLRGSAAEDLLKQRDLLPAVARPANPVALEKAAKVLRMPCRIGDTRLRGLTWSPSLRGRERCWLCSK